MNNPSEPKGSVPKSSAGPDTATSPEPFVRLASLAPRERSGLDASTYEERTGTLIKRASVPEGLDPARLDALWRRLDRHNVAGRNLLGAPLRWALIATVLVISGGAVGAGTGVWTWPRVVVRRLTGPTPVIPAPRARPPRGTVGRAHVGTESAPVSPFVPAVDVPEASPPVMVPAPLPALSSALVSQAGTSVRKPRGERPAIPVAPSVSVPPEATSSLAEETRLLGHALSLLRQGQDPAAALVELDRYAARFPSGTLTHEARTARVDALLMAGRLAEARTVLSNLPLGAGARDLELRLMRAELTAEKSCGAALPDYQIVLEQSRSGPLAQRALWGRATCHARLGEEASARADLDMYIARFPNGPHAAAARARLRL